MNKNQIKEKIVLEANNITKDFPGVRALDNVSFELKAGEIHALLDEKVMGKPTLSKVIADIDLKVREAILVDYN